MPESDASNSQEPAASGGFERIFNPYVIGNPIRGGEPFFGREDDFAFVARRLESERSGIVLLFAGARRSGKTSIMFQILDGRLGDEILPVFIDMQALSGIDGDAQMLGRIARSVIEGVGDERLVVDYYEFDEGNPILTFDRLLADINQIFPDKRLLLLVDEAELLRDKVSRGEISPAVLTFMASALESRKVSFFFTGSPGLPDTDVPEWKRLMGKGDFKEISFLSPTDTSRLATEPLDDRVSYGDGVLTSIYQLSYGHPFYTQLICTNAVDHLNSHSRYDMGAEDLEEVVRTVVNNPPPQLVYDWEQLQHEEQLVLSLLSEVSVAPHIPVAPEALLAAIQENEYPIDISAADLHGLLDSLDARMILSRSDDGGYHFLVDLVRLWIRRNRSVWRLVEEQDVVKPTRPWGVIAAAAVGILMIAGAALFLTGSESSVAPESAPRAPDSGSVWLETFPVGTQVQVRGPLDGEGEPDVQLRDRTPTMVDGRQPGLYVVVLEHPSYARREDTLHIAAGRRDTVGGTLQRLVGGLTVSPRQLQARTRIVNQTEHVDTSVVGPAEVRELPTGTYEVDVALAGFRSWQGQVEVLAGEEQRLQPDLVADVGSLVVLSTPPGATLFLDDESQGLTPQVLEQVTSGRHRLRLERQDYQVHESLWEVCFGCRDTVSLDLLIKPASLTVTSTPPGARILFDGVALLDSVTPQRLTRPPGTYRLRLALAGYDDHDEVLQLLPGGAHELTPTLQQQFGHVKIARPLFGTLAIDGVRGKEGPLGIRTLPVGRYRLELEGRTGHFDIEVAKDETTTVMWE
jgi:hypothetical protein